MLEAEMTMKVVYTKGDDELARVFVMALDDGTKIELVESIQPPLSRKEKWVLIVSTLKGCPVGCPICDAGGTYGGKLSKEELLDQIEFLITRRYPDGYVPVPKLKIQFARMGDPAFNTAVLDALEDLPVRFHLPGLIPCISTVAPRGRDPFFERLLRIKQDTYPGGRFQMQFSVHTTDEQARKILVPTKTWSLSEMAAYGDRFFAPGDRKITLNFAAAKGLPLVPEELAPLFSPDNFLIKLTPINPTLAARRSGIQGLLDPGDDETCQTVTDRFRALGYDTILSIGELKENEIGSNCGMYVAEQPSAKRPSDQAVMLTS